MTVTTSPRYWDCECQENYIHKKTVTLHCPICGCNEEDMPDSMLTEVIQMLTDKINKLKP
jgi:hypothetical protein